MILDDTIYYPIEEYKNTINRYVNKLKNNEQIKALYQFGSISAPGLSDIDLLIVSTNRYYPEKFEYNNLLTNNTDNYLFIHAPLVINSELFNKLLYWYPISNLNKIYGIELENDIIPDNELEIINVIKILHIFYYKIPISFYGIFKKRSISSRVLIALIKSISHTYNLYKNIGGKNIEQIEKYLNDFLSFRKEWFTLEKSQRILILESFKSQLPSIISEFIYYINKLLLIKIRLNNSQNISYKCNNIYYRYTSDWNKCSFKNSLFINTSEIVFPYSFSLLLQYGAAFNLRISKYIRSHGIKLIQLYPEDQKEAIKTHFIGIELYSKFRAKYFSNYGIRGFTYGYRPIYYSVIRHIKSLFYRAVQ